MGIRIKWWRTLLLVLLFIITALSAVFAWSRYTVAVPIEISITETEDFYGMIYIGDNVTLPGFYTYTTDDSISDLINAAGGTNRGTNLSMLKLEVPMRSEESPQRVDINRAEPWLLQALPGIGKALAQRIVDYRQQNGPFLDTWSLTKVSGIGEDEYSKINNLITVYND